MIAAFTTALRIVLLVAFGGVSVALAADPAPGGSFDAAVEKVQRLSERWVGPHPKPESCARLDPTAVACGEVDVTACRLALERIFDEPPTADADQQLQRARVGTALHALAEVERAVRAGACPQLAAAPHHAADVELDADGRTLHVRAVPPLRAGRRYVLEAHGVTPQEREALRESAKPGGQSGTSYAAIAGERLEEIDTPVDPKKLTALLARWEAETVLLPGVGNDVPLRLSLPAPADAKALSRISLRFVPEGAASEDHRIAELRTLDGRAGLRAYRERLASKACEPVPLLRAGDEYVGAVEALDIRATEGRARLLGSDATRAKWTNLPVRLVVPATVANSTPLVLLVPGHHLTAEAMLAEHGAALLARGMAVLAIDLPRQGARASGEGELLDILDPAHLSLELRRAATDVLAVVRAARECGFGLSDGVYRPDEIRYFGFSLGAMVGTLARTVSPDLGATVLVAPGGGIARWLKLRILSAIGAPLVSCSAGPDAGKSCLETGRCASPGICRRDPGTEQLWTFAEPSYAWLSAGADPLTFATETTGDASKAPLLILTGGEDAALHPELASRLADAYRMKRVSEHEKRGSHSRLVQFPDLGHELLAEPTVRSRAYGFLASGGRARP